MTVLADDSDEYLHYSELNTWYIIIFLFIALDISIIGVLAVLTSKFTIDNLLGLISMAKLTYIM